MQERLIRDLTLMLLYLTSWPEKAGLTEARRSWKGYSFDALNELNDQGLIAGGKRAKSVWLTEEGEEKARALLAQYGFV